VGEGDGDGWLRARNYKGEEGYVPHNYLDVEREQTASTPGLVNQISFSSVDYTVDNEEEPQVPSETNQSPEQVSVISVVSIARRLHHFHIVRTAAGPGSRNAHRFVLLRPLRLRRRRRRRAHFRRGSDHQSSEQVRSQRRRRLVEGRVGRSRR
jgi:hypothetical protein